MQFLPFPTIQLTLALGITCSSALAQTQSSKLVASGAQPAEAFGYAVELDGPLTVVGARNAIVNGIQTGAVYVFDSATGQELYELAPSDGAAGDMFGFSLALENGILLVGAPHHAVDGVPDNGLAYLFDVSTGLEIGRLQPGTLESGGRFGASVDLDGYFAAVSAYGRDTAVVDAGEAFIFHWGMMIQIHSLVADDANKSDSLGWSVAIEDNKVLVGAPLDRTSGVRMGATYIFDGVTGLQVHKLTPNDGGSNDRFGWRVALDNGVAAVGAHMHDGGGIVDSGAVYLFDVAAGNETAKHLSPEPGSYDAFGFSLDLEGNRLVVGAPYQNSSQNDTGAVYVLNRLSGQQEFKVQASDKEQGDLFGNHVSLDGDTLLVGAVQEDDGGVDAGAAYLIDLGSCSIQYCQASGSSPNNTATLSASGCDLSVPITLDLGGGPVGQFTYLLVGSGAGIVTNPAGALGDLCLVGGTLKRYTKDLGAITGAGGYSTDISNSLSGGPGFGIPNSGGAVINSGETWNFQYWHRNPGGAASGFSEALSVTFR